MEAQDIATMGNSESVPEELCEQALSRAMPVIRKLARRIARCSRNISADQVDDLVQVGALGFLCAYRGCRDQVNLSRSQYALLRSRQAIYEHLRSSSPNKRALRSKAKTFNFAFRHMSVLYGRQPTEIELADTVGMAIEEYRKALAEISRAGLFDPSYLLYTRRRETATARDTPEPDGEQAGENDRAELSHQLRQAVAALPERERSVIEQRYLVESETQGIVSMGRIGSRLGFQGSYVSKLHKRALRRLETILADRRDGGNTGSRYCRPSLER